MLLEVNMSIFCAFAWLFQDKLEKNMLVLKSLRTQLLLKGKEAEGYR